MARLTPQDVTLLNQELRDLVAAKVPLPEGLRAFEASLDAGGLQEAASEVAAALEAGRSLSEALGERPELPATYGALLRAGEASGDVAGVLEGLVHQAEQDAQFHARVRDALVYPAVSLGFVIVFGVIALSQLPALDSTFANLGVSPPTVTALMLQLGAVAKAGMPVWILLGVGLAFAVPRWSAWPGRLLVWPFVHHDLRWRQLAGLSRSLAAFVHRDVPLAEAFTALRLAETPYLPAEQLQRIEDRLVAGQPLSEALKPERAVFPPTYVWRLSAAEARGNLGDALLSLSRRYEERLRQRMAMVTGLAVPLALIVVAAFTGLIMLGVFLPIFELQKALQQ